MINKNDEFELLITDIGNDGEGIGRYDGMAFFVKGAVIGDRILAGATKLKKTYGYARVVRVLQPSPFRVTPPCPIASRCGGCQLQNLDYGKQLDFKENKVLNDLIRLGEIAPERFVRDSAAETVAGNDENTDESIRTAASARVYFHNIIGMDNPINYRNKGQFPVGTDKTGKTVTGFYAGHSHSIVSADSCMIQHKITDCVMRTVRDFLDEEKISVFDENLAARCQEAANAGKKVKKPDLGLVRHVLTRVGFVTHEVMVCVVINGDELPAWKKLAKRLESTITGYDDTYRLCSFSVNINKEITNVILGEKVITLYGNGYITDFIGDIKYQISPLSFYQVNPVQTEVLYSTALKYAGVVSDVLQKENDLLEQTVNKGVIWDLYCGIGTISLFLAQKAKKVYGVEIVPQAIEDAKRNAEINGLDNVEFFVGAAEEILPRKYEEDPSMKADVIVVDPPRKGCDTRLLETLVKLAPERIVYVSCDPATLSRDVKYLEQSGYALTEVQPVDQFPFSVHVETVCLLSRKDN